MSYWIVTVKRRGDPQRRRIFVEDIEYEDEAERLALLKVGGNPGTHDVHADLVDDRVSIEAPNDNLEEVYEQTVRELDAVRRELKQEQFLSAEHLARAEKAEDIRDRLIQTAEFALTDISLVHTVLNKVRQDLRKGANAHNQRRPEEAVHESGDPS